MPAISVRAAEVRDLAARITTPHIASGFYLRAAEDAERRSEVRTFVTPVRDVAELEVSIGHFAACPWRIRKLRCDRHLEQTAAVVPPSVVVKDGMVGRRLARSFSRSAAAERLVNAIFIVNF